MEREYTRLDKVRFAIDPIINAIEDEEDKRCAYVHLYGTGVLASTLALQRGFSRDIAELAEIAGMMHDLLCYVDPSKDGEYHAHICADYARDMVLSKLDCFTDEEKLLIYYGIYNHSDKHIIGTDFDEIIKDADAIHHALRNPKEDYFFNKERTQRVLKEMNLIK